MEEIRIGYRYNAADIHSHVLPGVDDGAGNIGESLTLLRAALREGVRDVICTPHYGIENGYAPDADKVRKAFEELQAAKAKNELELGRINLYLGEEIYCARDADARLKDGRALRINGTRCALVEFLEYGDTTESAQEILQRLEKLKKSYEAIPILAHAERYRALQEDRDQLKRIRDLGVLIQVNAYDLSLNPNQKTRETAQWLAEERMISFLGSDMHGMPPKRPPKMRDGIDWLYTHTNQGYADEVVRKNAEKELRVKKYELWSEDDYFMTSRMAEKLEDLLNGKIVRFQAYPSGGEVPFSRAVVETEDGRVYAVIEGSMGKRLFRMEAFADDTNSYIGRDSTGWYWRWRATDRDIVILNMRGERRW